MTNNNPTNRRSALTGGQSHAARIVAKAEDKRRREATDGRGQAGHAGRRGVDNRGVAKKTLPLPLETHAQIERLAQAENIPQGDVVMLAVRILDEMHRAGKIDLYPFKELVYSDSQAWRSSTRLAIPHEKNFFDS